MRTTARQHLASTVAILLSVAAIAGAQATKPTLAVTSFEMPVYSYERNQLGAMLKSSLMQSLHDVKSVTVVDRTNSRRVDIATKEVRYIAYGTIERLDVTRTPKSRTYAASMTLTLNLLDAATGEVLANKTIEGSSEPAGKKVFGVMVQGSSNSESSADALSLLSKNVSPELATFFRDAIPVEYPVASVSEVPKDSSTGNVLIACGSGCGITNGTKLQLVERTMVTVSGKSMARSKDLGRVTIIKVEDENFSVGQLDATGAKDTIKRIGAKATIVAVPAKS